MDLKQHIRGIPDFPKPGILFYDISTLLKHPGAWKETVTQLTEALRPLKPDLLAGIESRGFLVGAPVAVTLGCGFVMIRKKGKLPGKTIPHTYDLEYGSDTVEIQSDAIEPGQRIVVIDDLLATGGTAAAAVRLCRMVGGNVVGTAFIIELTGLKGRARLDVPATALIDYEF
ncbi:MAG TPA: adenine phosphoribosyltransferase [Stellaceae bacterium]|nr:adenine phosphoribosyltransferase [Stellaceae bacterium]